MCTYYKNKLFNDIRVRKALQVSIDRKTIAENYYGGTVDWRPVGIMSPDYVGYCIPYDNWPEELQKGYSSEKILNGHSSHFARW